MDDAQKKAALRMIPYGLYVLTTEDDEGRVAAATVNWLTQASFAPPLVALGVKADSGAHALIKATGKFALNVLGKGQQDLAFAFFKPATKEGDSIAGQAYTRSSRGLPLLNDARAHIECTLRHTVEGGDHSLFVGEVVDATVNASLQGRPDDATLWLKDLGENVFYGG